MAASSTAASLLASPLPQTSPVRLLLRAEGLAVAVASAIVYAHLGSSWWLFAGLWLLPDLSLLGYLRKPCFGARLYNTFHSYLLPAVLALAAWLLNARLVLPVAVIWVNHIGVDRALGYGLKFSEGFAFTHLGFIGKVGTKLRPVER